MGNSAITPNAGNSVIFPNADNSQNMSYLYEITHDITTDNLDRKNTLFFTNILGVLCYLEFSKHKEDENIKLIVYKNELNIYQLDDEQRGMMLTVFPSLDEEFVSKDESVSLCKELYRLTLNKIKIEDVNNINKKYGSYLHVNKNRLSVCEHIKVDNVYDLNVSKITEDDKNGLQNLNEMEKINYLAKLTKMVTNTYNTVKVEKHLENIAKKENERIAKKENEKIEETLNDGKKSRRRKKKSRSSRKKKSRSSRKKKLK